MASQFEHEVWHDGAEDRIVLICDMWHPQLQMGRDVLPLITDAQRADLEAAMRGEHRTLEVRTYSTGASVQRGP